MFSLRKRSRVGAAVLAISAVGLLVAGCAGGSGTADPSGSTGGDDEIASMEPVNFIVSEPFPATNSNNHGTKLFIDYVTEHTDGKVTFEVYDSGTLHGLPEAISAIKSGLSDITLYIPGLAAADVPSGGWATGLAAYTGETPLDMLAGSAAASAAFSSTPITEELAANNAVILGPWTSDSYTLLCTKPVESLADSQGALGRSSGGTYDSEMESIGMTPVLVDANEVYEALQRGTVNCQVGALQTFVNNGLAEVAKFYTPLAFSPNTGPAYIVSKEKFDALPASVQEIFREAAPLFGIGNNSVVIEKYVEWYTTAEDEYDLEFVTADDELASTLADFRTEQGDTLADRAPESVTDPQAIIDLYKSVNDEWIQILKDEFGVPETDGSPESLLAAVQYVDEDFDWDKYRVRMYEYLRDLDIP